MDIGGVGKVRLRKPPGSGADMGDVMAKQVYFCTLSSTK